MSDLIKPQGFFRAISESPRLKFTLAWLTFIGLAVPVAALISFGLPEQYALPALLVLVLPFQYATFCLLQKHGEARAEEGVRAAGRIGVTSLEPITAHSLSRPRDKKSEEGVEMERQNLEKPPRSLAPKPR